MDTKHFWKMVKPFISKKNNADHNDIIFIEDSKEIRDDFFTDRTFISTGKQVIPLQEINHKEAIQDITTKYESHTNISNIKKNKP